MNVEDIELRLKRMFETRFKVDLEWVNVEEIELRLERMFEKKFLVLGIFFFCYVSPPLLDIHVPVGK